MLYLNEMPFCLIFCHIMQKKKKKNHHNFFQNTFCGHCIFLLFLSSEEPFSWENILCSVMDVFVTVSICNTANIQASRTGVMCCEKQQLSLQRAQCCCRSHGVSPSLQWKSCRFPLYLSLFLYFTLSFFDRLADGSPEFK